MSAYLVFRLYGPICSWGEIAVGESRHTADHPSRSALLGMFAAALGIERNAEEEQQSLSKAWRFGIKLLTPGVLLRDYHTVQTPRQNRNVRHRTRRSELLTPDVNTLLSFREYRTDNVSIVAAELRERAKWTLAIMQGALERPYFQLYLGRKSCPLALPLAPRIVETPSLRAALDSTQPSLAALDGPPQKEHAQASAPWPGMADRRAFRMERARYFWEAGMQLDQTESEGSTNNYLEFVRNDQPLSRRRWQFTRRREWAYLAPADTNGTGEA